MAFPVRFLVALTALTVAFLYQPVQRRLTVFGVYRTPTTAKVSSASDWISISNTRHCEDLHYHAASDKLFTACDDHDSLPRYSWFPAINHFDDPYGTQQGSLMVIDPRTMTARKLNIQGFTLRFVTHGFDILTDPEDPQKLHIFVINHLPNPIWVNGDKAAPKARSQVEIFEHTLGSSTARWIRSVRDPLIATPNDIHIISPTSFYVTNDHYYRQGVLRQIEDLVTAAKWSTTIHVTFSSAKSSDATADVSASVALTGLHNNNGIAHGPGDEIIINSAAGGICHITKVENVGSPALTVVDRIEVDSCLDNPSYYTDPYAHNPGSDSSGYVLGGLSKALVSLEQSRMHEALDAGIVWHVSRNQTWAGGKQSDKWIKRLLWEDDGSKLRFLTTAVIVPIDPKEERGQKKGWLFTTGLFATNVAAFKIDLW